MKFFFKIKETYSAYRDGCNATQLCNPAKFFTCLSNKTSCNCPDDTLIAGQCDCPTTHYYDSNTAACVDRVSATKTCSDDYMCN